MKFKKILEENKYDKDIHKDYKHTIWELEKNNLIARIECFKIYGIRTEYVGMIYKKENNKLIPQLNFNKKSYWKKGIENQLFNLLEVAQWIKTNK